jgi:uncharacterized membrane protein
LFTLNKSYELQFDGCFGITALSAYLFDVDIGDIIIIIIIIISSSSSS